MKRVYADHAATTRPAPEVLEAMAPWLGERFANPSSVHARGEAGREAVETARVEVARIEPDALVQLVHHLALAFEHLQVVAGVLEQGAADAQRGVASARGGEDALQRLLVGGRRGEADVEQAGKCFHGFTARA